MDTEEKRQPCRLQLTMEKRVDHQQRLRGAASSVDLRPKVAVVGRLALAVKG